MNIQERESGLLVATDKPLYQQQTAPPEHPSRKVIRDALASLSLELGAFEQTTHGYLGPCDIESVARKLAVCYKEPDAYTISNLAQAINGLAKEK